MYVCVHVTGVGFRSRCPLSLPLPGPCPLLQWAKFKQNVGLKKMGGSKKSNITGIPKLDDANNAGGRKSQACTLILTEGDSAKSLAVRQGRAGQGRAGQGRAGQAVPYHLLHPALLSPPSPLPPRR